MKEPEAWNKPLFGSDRELPRDAEAFAERVRVACDWQPAPGKAMTGKVVEWLEIITRKVAPLLERIAELEAHCKNLNERLYAAVKEEHVTFGDRTMTGQEVVDRVIELEAENAQHLRTRAIQAGKRAALATVVRAAEVLRGAFSESDKFRAAMELFKLLPAALAAMEETS